MIKDFTYPDDMDKECVPLCDILNSLELTTEFSCCGHGKDDFVILFSKEVSDDMVITFLRRISEGKDHTPLVGEFLKWYRFIDGELHENWEYRVQKIEFANTDYNTIKRIANRTGLKCGNCKRFIGGGDWGLCCQIDAGLYYEDSDACDDYEPKEETQ